MGNMCSEITLPGIFGLDQWNWSGNNEIYAVWKLAPCCGGPDVIGALKCILHWWILGPCSFAHLYGSSVGAGCTIFPQCLFAWFLPCIAAPLTRYNLRKKAGQKGNIIGDLVCMYFLGPCACCQELRAASVNDWALWPIPAVQVTGPMKFIN